MLLPIEANQIKQDFEPLLGRETPVVGAVGGIGLGVVIEPADDTLHLTILSSFLGPSAPSSFRSADPHHSSGAPTGRRFLSIERLVGVDFLNRHFTGVMHPAWNHPIVAAFPH
jgi:hypothetical protein